MSEISYCRWSTDDFQCDLYIYEDWSGGWTTHVAGNRLVWHEGYLPAPLELTSENAEAWADRYMKVMDLLRNGEDSIDLAKRSSEAYHREDIDLPHTGQTFNDPTPGACADRVEQLLALGYRCPSELVESLRAEQEELDAPEAKRLANSDLRRTCVRCGRAFPAMWTVPTHDKDDAAFPTQVVCKVDQCR